MDDSGFPRAVFCRAPDFYRAQDLYLERLQSAGHGPIPSATRAAITGDRVKLVWPFDHLNATITAIRNNGTGRYYRLTLPSGEMIDALRTNFKLLETDHDKL